MYTCGDLYKRSLGDAMRRFPKARLMDFQIFYVCTKCAYKWSILWDTDRGDHCPCCNTYTQMDYGIDLEGDEHYDEDDTDPYEQFFAEDAALHAEAELENERRSKPPSLFTRFLLHLKKL
jgi:hypothetical protein